MSQSMNRPPKPCTFFARGECSEGSDCRFYHGAGRDVITPRPPLPKASHSAICSFWAQGRCSKGSACAFQHANLSLDQTPQIVTPSFIPPVSTASDVDLTAAFSRLSLFGSDPGDPTRSPAVVGWIPHKPCAFWQAGKCTKGDSCTYGHWGAGASASAVSQRSSSPSDSHSSAVCRFWSRGHCTYGTRCRLDHPIASTPLPASDAFSGDQKKVLEADTVERSYGSTRTTFTSGAQVQTVITSLESSRLIISNLPEDCTDTVLKTLLDPFSGIIHSKIQHKLQSEGVITSACVEFRHPDQAAEAYAVLEGADMNYGILSCRLERPYQSGSGSLQTTTVQLSWKAPYCMAFAHYPTEAGALAQAMVLGRRGFRGSDVSAEVISPRGSRWSQLQGSNYTVLIKGLPVDAEVEDLEEWASTDSVDLRLTYSEKEAQNALEVMMESIGPVLSFRHLPHNSQRRRCLVTFREPDVAVTAATRYNNTRYPFIGNGSLYVKTIWSLRLYVLARQFSVIEQELYDIRQTLMEIQGGCRLHIEKNDTKVILTLSGSDIKDFGAIKRRVQQTLGGDVVTDRDGSVLWDPFFDTPAGRTFIHNISQQTKSFVFRDTKRQILTLSGTPEARAAAKELILNQIGERRVVGPLDRHTWQQMLSGRLKELRAEIGEETVALDVTNRLLLIRGSEQAFRIASAAVQSARDAESPVNVNPDQLSACPICLCEPTNAIQISCGHRYCHACLRDYLMSTRDTKTFPVICVSESGGVPCKSSIALSVIQKVLTTEQERLLLNAAFTAHVQQHPKDLRYCPTPDCDWIYRPQTSGAVILCETCFQRICAACHVLAHEGLTCEEHLEVSTPEGRAYKEYKKANNVKACPKCGADIFKDGGCNHVECRGCKTHMCWVCMRSFEQSGDVYTHMTNMHGGIGV